MCCHAPRLVIHHQNEETKILEAGHRSRAPEMWDTVQQRARGTQGGVEMRCNVCLEEPCCAPAQCDKERARSVATYGEIPVGTEVEIIPGAVVVTTPRNFYRSFVFVGDRPAVDVKESPYPPVPWLGEWEPSDPNGRLFLKRGKFRRVS